MISIVLAVVLGAHPGVEAKISRVRVDAPDRTALTLYRYESDTALKASRAIILFPDFGFGRSLFAGGDAPLTQFLLDRGYRVYIAQVRGQGASMPFDSLQNIEHLDVPTIIRKVSSENAAPVDVVAHGWLGALVLAASTDPTLKIHRIVAVNAPVTAEVPSDLVKRFLIAGGSFSKLTSTEAGLHDYEAMMALWSQMQSREIRALARNGMRDLGPLLSAALLEWMQTGDLVLSDGLRFSEVMTRYSEPTLVLAGLADGFANPEFAVTLRDVSHAQVYVHVFTRIENVEDYSHASIFQGPGASGDVFGPMVKFLQAEKL